MGCHNSKQACRDVLRSPSRNHRSNSFPAFRCFTLDSEKEQCVHEDESEDVLDVLATARAWSATIGRRILRMPIKTPAGESEPVDKLELMASLHADKTGGKNGKDKAVIYYFTSLRGVRKTYDDCRSVRAVLKEYGVRVDERDVSMHAAFKEELRELSGGVSLPRVSVGGRDLGGEEEVRRMHESGELGKVLEGLEGGKEEECEGCGGDIRFVLCDRCSGSCKVYVDKSEEGGEGWRRCLECNENGIVRCPLCC